MSTSLIIERDISSSSEREERAQRLATLFIGEMVPLLIQVRQDFYDKKTDELIFGCRTWEDYCQSVLQYSKRHINRLIQGQNPATKFDGSQNRKVPSLPTLESLPVPEESQELVPSQSPQAAPTVKCPDCDADFNSISATIRHAKQEHGLLGTDVAAFKRRMLGEAEPPLRKFVSDVVESHIISHRPKEPHCTLTEKNIGDTRCLSMAKERLWYLEGKVQLLLGALREPEQLNKDAEVRKVLKVYLGAFRDFKEFLDGGIALMESELVLAEESH
jgi:hypothetical protein